MSGRVSLAPTNDRHDADRLRPLHCTESDRDLAYLIRTSLRFSAQQERGGSSRRLHRRQPVARSQDLFSPLRHFRRRLAIVGSVAHLVAKDPGGRPRLRRSWQGPPRGTAGSRIPGALLAAAAAGRCGSGVGHPLRSAPRRLATPTLSSRWGSAPAELSSRLVG
jgi:hypothetical protein